MLLLDDVQQSTDVVLLLSTKKGHYDNYDVVDTVHIKRVVWNWGTASDSLPVLQLTVTSDLIKC